jgi:PAS domain S-box-containing protein
MSLPALIRTNRVVRSAAFAYCALPLALRLWEYHAGPAAWTLLGLQFFAYPQLVYLRAARSAHPLRAELDNLFLDAVLFGAWVAYLGFPVWIGFALVAAAMLNAAVNRGPQGALVALGCSALGAGLWVLVGGLRLSLDTSTAVTLLAMAGSVAYTSAVGVVVWKQTRRLSAARHELAKSEERYRLIAENADDLVAAVDEEGRWLYTSPSYRRMLEPAQLEAGGEVFNHIHADDVQPARMAIARAAMTGKPRYLPLRLVDREGRVRQYRVHLQPVVEGKAPYKIILVSHDVTDLRETEERVLLAAHALEGTTEAIMITGADGTIVTVNPAFCEITGLAREAVLGHSEKSIRSGLKPAGFYDELYAEVQREGYWTGTIWNRRPDGSVYREWRSVRAVRDGAGAVTHYIHVFYEGRRAAQRRRLLVSLASRVGIRSAPLQGNRLEA